MLALLGISVLAFCTAALVPGSPAEVLLGPAATPERQVELTRELGLDEPIPLRYLYWLRALVQGDMGESVLSQQPVVSLIGSALLVSLELAVFSMLLALLVALPLGLRVGFRSDRWWARPAMFLVTIGMSVPAYVTGLIFITVFAVNLGWLPPGGFVPFREDPVGNLKSMLLPTVTLALWLAPPIVRFIRASTVAVTREDYVAMARAKGVGNTRLLRRHIAPNAAIPAITYLGLQLGVLVSGAIVVEVIFSLPGMGRLGLNAVLDRDYPLIQGVVLVIALGYVCVNLLVDVLYGVIDPRVKVGG
jgi:peptide/nickel transport system permease protein